MMRNVLPVFVSCKNGRVTSGEPYKLSTVAEHFGGQYAPKVRLATFIPERSEAGKYLRQHAGNMQIRLIERIQKMTDRDLEKLGNEDVKRCP